MISNIQNNNNKRHFFQKSMINSNSFLFKRQDKGCLAPLVCDTVSFGANPEYFRELILGELYAGGCFQGKLQSPFLEDKGIKTVLYLNQSKEKVPEFNTIGQREKKYVINLE